MRELEPILFLVADHGVVENGKLYVNGGLITVWRLPAYPAIVPPFTVCAAINVPSRAFQQDHKFVIALEDADGGSLFRTEGEFKAVANLEMRPGDPLLMPVAISVAGLQINRAGDYTFTMAIDGTPVERYSMRAVELAMTTTLPFLPGPSDPIP
jgi:hypothetical protein